MSNVSLRSFESQRSSSQFSVKMNQYEEHRSESTIELRSLGEHESDTIPHIKPSYRLLFTFASRKHYLPLCLAVFFSILYSLLKPASAIVFGRLFSILTQYGAGELDIQATMEQTARCCITLMALGGTAWLVEGVWLSQWMIFGELQAATARKQLFAGLLKKNMEWYDLHQDGTGSLMVRIQTQIREFQMGIAQPIGLVTFEASSAVASLILGLISSWKLTLVIFATFPVFALVLWLISKNLSGAIEAQKRDLTLASKYANTSVTAINTVKAFNGQDQELWQHYNAIKDAAKSYLVQARANSMQFGVLKFFVVGLFVVGFWYGIYLVRGGLDAGLVVTTFYACLTVLQSAETILPQWLVLMKGLSAAATLRFLLEELPTEDLLEKKAGGFRPDKCSGDIEVVNVTFAYPSNSGQKALHNSTFFFPAGETSYIIGRSGSGKSTLSNLLLKYYEPHSGEIFLDGHRISDLDTNWVRQNITLVQQQSVLFNDTIFQNISLGKTSESSESDVWEAAKIADLEKTLLDLADGVNTVVGLSGKSLSGGQQQRIAIARARLRDTPILILDEATSALDQRSREKVHNLIRDWRRGKTTIVITHDVSQIMDNDYLYVIENGAVAQEGYYNKLARKPNGIFASLLPAQDVSKSRDSLRRMSDPGSPISPISDTPLQPQSTRWSYIQGVFGSSSAQPNSGTFGGIPGTRFSTLGIGSAPLSVLKSDNIWSDQVSEPYTKRMSLAREPHKTFKPPENHIESQKYLHGSVDLTHTQILTSKQTFQPQIEVANKPSRAIKGSHDRQRSISAAADAGTVVIAKREKDSSTSLKDIFVTVWPTLTGKQRLVLVLGFVAAFVVGACTPTFAYVFARLLGVYYTSSNQVVEARSWSLILVGIAITDGVASFSYHYAHEYCGQAWVDALRVKALKRVLAQPKSWFDKEQNSPGRLSELLDRSAEEMRNLLGRFIGTVFVAFCMLCISIVWAFTISWKLSLVTLATGPFLFLATRVFDHVSGKWEEKSNIAAVKASTVFTETFTSIRVVRALTLEKHFERKHTRSVDATLKVGRKRALYSGSLFGFTDSMSYFISALVFFYGVRLFSQKQLSVDEVLQVIQILMFGIANAGATLIYIPQINSSRAAATNMLHLANLPLESHESMGHIRLATPFPIQMKDLSFAYNTHAKTRTLSNIDLVLRPGTCTALVGPSGSGKSTIASLLLGLYPPDFSSSATSSERQALTFNSQPISRLNISSLRTFIATVPQQPHLFPSSILSNILYGLPEDHPFATLPHAECAAKDAGIHEFILSLPDGYNTLIGEGGICLSGGQVQRIAIARAIVRRPSILILDEATSALDAISAKGIREMIGRFLDGEQDQERCVVTISHGVEMMKIADEIVVIEGGKVVEKGGFEELRSLGGRFCDLIGEKGMKGKGKEEESASIGLGLEADIVTPVDPRKKQNWGRGDF